MPCPPTWRTAEVRPGTERALSRDDPVQRHAFTALQSSCASAGGKSGRELGLRTCVAWWCYEQPAGVHSTVCPLPVATASRSSPVTVAVLLLKGPAVAALPSPVTVAVLVLPKAAVAVLPSPST